MFRDERTLAAPHDKSLRLWIEPWAQECTAPPGTVVTLRAESPGKGQLEIVEAEDATWVYAWVGSTLEIFAGSERLALFDIPPPAVPEGMTMREFVRGLFGAGPRTPEGVERRDDAASTSTPEPETRTPQGALPPSTDRCCEAPPHGGYPFVGLCISDRAYIAEGPDATVVAPSPGDRLGLLTTVGKHYQIIGEKLGMYVVVNNMDSTSLHPKPYFRRLEESNPWPFVDPPNMAVCTTADVLERGLPIVRVTHDEDDGCWQFHSANGAPEDLQEARVVGLKTIVRLDPTITTLADLPLGWCALRDAPGTPWRRERTTSG